MTPLDPNITKGTAILPSASWASVNVLLCLGLGLGGVGLQG